MVAEEMSVKKKAQSWLVGRPRMMLRAHHNNAGRSAGHTATQEKKSCHEIVREELQPPCCHVPVCAGVGSVWWGGMCVCVQCVVGVVKCPVLAVVLRRP